MEAGPCCNHHQLVLDASAQAWTTKQATNGITIDRCSRALEPIERREPVVVVGARISAMLEEDCDRLHEACFRRVVKRGRLRTVGPCPVSRLSLTSAP
jgi:hypothetical protein